MTIIVLLIGFSLTIATGFLVALLCSMKSGQFDDTESPAVRMLFDNYPKKTTGEPVERATNRVSVKDGNLATGDPNTDDKSHGLN